jgi:hypothetical protein
MDLQLAHSFSRGHREQVEQSEGCSCFRCLASFKPSEITEWVDGGDTALCPKCGVDAVLASASGVPLSDEFLRKMQQQWF